MLKLIKRVFLFCFILLIGTGIWAYKNGMRQDNYKEFLSSILLVYQQKEQPSKIETKPAEAKPKIKKKKDAKINIKYELQPLPRNPFSSVDNHSRISPSFATTDIKSLATFLQQKAITDIEKARSIYIWITDNIRYDDDAFNSGVYPDYTAEYVLQNRKAVCDGFSNLYLALGSEMELDIEKVSGYAKGYGYDTGSRFREINHSWNVIKVNGKWQIFDSTWGRGHGSNVNGKLVTKKDFNDYWFNVDPYESIFNHFSQDFELNYIQPSLTLSQYEKMPNIDEEYFDLGFKGRETFSAINSNPNSEFPKVYKLKTHIEIISAPKFKNLDTNQSYYFEFYVPRGFKVTAINSADNWTNFERGKGKFKLNFTPNELGELLISVQHEKSGKFFETILVYNVKEMKETIY